MKILLTGANGYLGQYILKYCSANGIEVQTLGRKKVHHDIKHYFWTLGSTPAPEALENVDYLIHAAWETRNRNFDEMHLNIGGSRKLIDAVAELETDLIFISSVSAASNASCYGQGKSAVERYNTKGLNIRFGKLSPTAFSVNRTSIFRHLPIPIPSGMTISVIETDKAVATLFDLLGRNSKGLTKFIEGEPMLLDKYYLRYQGQKTIKIPFTLFDTIFRLLSRIPFGRVRAISDKWNSLKGAA